MAKGAAVRRATRCFGLLSGLGTVVGWGLGRFGSGLRLNLGGIVRHARLLSL
jgi:hypothetical protein